MDQARPLELDFIEKALAVLELMLQTSSNYEEMRPKVQLFSAQLQEAMKLMLDNPSLLMREDGRKLLVDVRRGILELLRFFDVRESEQYQAFLAAKSQIDPFLASQ